MKAFVPLIAVALCCGCNKKSAETESLAQKPAVSVERAPARSVPGPRVEPTVQTGPHAVRATPSPAKGIFEPAPYLEGATCVAAWASDGQVTIAAGGPGWLKLFGNGTEAASTEIEGACQHLELVGPNDGHLVALYGSGRGAADVKGSARLLSRALEEVHRFALPKTTRHQLIGATDAGADSIYLGSFESKYFVEIAKHTRTSNAWTVTPIAKIRMPWRMASGDFDGDGDRDLVVVRPYGDAREALGDALLVTNAGNLKRIPTTMGARAVAVSEADRAIVIADGWHQNYGKNARALITRVEMDASKNFSSKRLAEVDGRSGFSRLFFADIEGDGKREVLACGDGPLVIVPIDGGQVSTLSDAGACADAAATNVDGKPGDEVIVLGERPGIWYPARAGT